MDVRRRSILIVTALLACAALPATAQGATYHVTTTGDDANPCTAALPCLTVQRAIDEHRVAPDPSDVIDVGPGLFVGNFGADDNLGADVGVDDGLTIRGTLSGETRDTTLRGEGAGFSGGFGSAFFLGSCGASAVTLRDVNADTVGADLDVYAIEAEGGSDLVNVHASNQPDWDTDQVVQVCQRGTEIRRSTIDATGSDAPDSAAILGLDGFQLIDSHLILDPTNGPGIVHFPLFGENRALVVRRTWIENDPANISEFGAILTGGNLTVDSSLITGGEFGIVRDFSFGVRGKWTVRNATIDLANPGQADPGLADLALWSEDGDAPIDATVTNSILAEGIVSLFFANPGPGSVLCTHTDVQEVVLDPTFTDNCDIGPGNPNGNTTTPPGDQFVGGAPFAWSLLATAPAIEAGTPGAVPAEFSQTDLAGDQRRAAPASAGCPAPIVDMGAYEFSCVPCNTKLPQIRNGASPAVGDQLGANPGKWRNGPTSFQNRWVRCDADGVSNCAPIMAFRSNRRGYTPTAADIGHTLRVEFMATNGQGDSDPASSDPTGVVIP